MADVSRNVVAALLVLVIVVSGFGTWSVLSSEKPSGFSGSNQASMELTVKPVPRDSGSIELSVGDASHG